MTQASKRHSMDDLARRFHEAYERLAPEHGYLTREETAVPWDDVPASNRALMVATVTEAFGGLVEQLEASQAALRLMLDMYERHAGWCGYNKDAPGDHIHIRATDAARAALDSNPAIRRSGRPESVTEWPYPASRQENA